MGISGSIWDVEPPTAGFLTDSEMHCHAIEAPSLALPRNTWTRVPGCMLLWLNPQPDLIYRRQLDDDYVRGDPFAVAVFVSRDADFRVVPQRFGGALQPLGRRDAIAKTDPATLNVDASEVSNLPRDIDVLACFPFRPLDYEALENAFSRKQRKSGEQAKRQRKVFRANPRMQVAAHLWVRCTSYVGR